KAERGDVEEIFIAELGGRVAFDREPEIAHIHSSAVVRDANERETAAGRDDLNLACAGIDGVLDEFLDDARWTLDDLAGRDAVDRLRCELADGHVRRLTPVAWRGKRPTVPYLDSRSRVSTLASSTAGWSKGSSPMSQPARIVSIMKCIIKPPSAAASSCSISIVRTGLPARLRASGTASACAATNSATVRPPMTSRPAILARAGSITGPGTPFLTRS